MSSSNRVSIDAKMALIAIFDRLLEAIEHLSECSSSIALIVHHLVDG